jgi:hypothetical protein
MQTNKCEPRLESIAATLPTKFQLILLLIPALLSAQTVDTGILGTVTDQSGAVVPKAMVTITQPATGLTRTIRTAEDGSYEVGYLRPGEYVVEVKANGFRTESRAGVLLQIAQMAHIDFSLQVGETMERVEVSASALLLNTQNAALGEVVTPERIVNLPLNGRDFSTLAALTPGVRATTSAANTSLFTANGVRSNSAEIAIDGATVTDNRLSYVTNHPSIDALQEFKVQSGNYSAEYGGSAGSNISVQLRSGTNQLHGAVFEFLRNNVLDARGYFRPRPLPKDTLRRNNFGAVLAGPIVKDKTFFMVSYEGQRYKAATPSTNIVPTPAMRRGDFSAVLAPISDPLNGGAPFAGNIIPSSRLNPVSVNLINLYMPLPNSAGAVNYAGVSPQIGDQDQGLARIDHYFGPRDQLFGHYTYQFLDYSLVDFNPNFPGTRTNQAQSVAAQYVHTFGAKVLNELRFGYWRGHKIQLSPYHDTSFTAADLGINGLKVGKPLTAHEASFPMIDISGFVGMGDRVVNGFPQDLAQTVQLIDNINIIRGSHALKMGIDLRRKHDDASTSNVPAGDLSFTSDITGNSMAAYMLGFLRTVTTPEGIPVDAVRQWVTALYFQDDWKVSRNLTVNLGARYDLIGVPSDETGIARTLRWDLSSSGPILWPPPGQSGPLWKGQYNDIAPRVGFAYRLKDNMVVRGGYGIFTTTPILDNINILQLTPPASESVTITNDPKSPIATIQNPAPPQLVPQNPLFNISTLPPDRKHLNGYYQNWNLQVSREFTRNDVVELGYVGTRGTHMYSSVPNFNSPPPGPGDIQSRRPYPQWGRIRMEATDGNSIYEALQVRIEHRFSHGLSLTSAYNWSHMIDDQDNTGRAIIQNPLNRGYAERGNSTQDVRQRLVTAYVWQLPFGRALKGAPGFVAAGWSLGGIVTLQSGSPFTVYQSGDSQNVDPVNGESRPNLVAGQQAAIPASQRDPALWFNTAAFSRSVFQYGNTPRDSLVGAGLKTCDLSASKSYKMPFNDKHEFLFRAEFFNAFNTPQFSNPGNVLGTGTFGRVTATSTAQRQIQFGVKYVF